MSGNIPQSFLDELLARTDLVEIIDSRVKLRKAGMNFSALCPFHNEKTPSFSVSPSKQFYYCFGCGAHGNAISFLMQYDRMEFVDAVETLAAKLGLTVPREGDIGKKTQTDSYLGLYTLLERATQYYQEQLRLSPIAIDYLKSRGITGAIAKKFGIGFAADAWEQLTNHIAKNKQDHADLQTTGMLIKNARGKIYDRFRNRIMFPIRNLRGHVIGFGGRTIGNEMPKYLNSPETSIFHKNEELYGLYEARQANKELDKIIIVEGYMDVVALVQHEITHVVATLGTATSSKHIQRLLRYTSELIFCFDGDQAGLQAAWRALTMALPFMRDGIRVAFMLLPQDEDPDSLVRKEGKQAFLTRVNQASSLADFFFDKLSQNVNLQQMDGKAKLAKLANEFLEKLPAGIFRELMYERLAQLIGVDIDTLQHYLTAPVTSPINTPLNNKSVKIDKPGRTASPVRLAIVLLLQHPELIRELTTAPPLTQIPLPGLDLLHQLIQLLQQQPKLTTGGILEHWRNQPYATQLAKLAAKEHLIPIEGLGEELRGAILRINEFAREQLISQLLEKASQNALSLTEKQQLQKLIAERN